MLIFLQSLLVWFCAINTVAWSSHVGVVEVVVRVEGGEDVAQLLAEETGHRFRGPVMGFDDTYIFVPNENHQYYQKRGMGIGKRLASDERVLRRQLYNAKVENLPMLLESWLRWNDYTYKSQSDDLNVIWADPQTHKDRQKRDFYNELNTRRVHKRPLYQKSHGIFNDELWSQEWYLQDTRSRFDLPKLDLNVVPVYKAGITGKGVRISILDDGIEYTHDDLRRNYDAEISYDCNEEDDDPLPRYEPTRFNSHGTRCAGEVSMAADNGKCGVGIAYGSRIGGVKLLDGLVTDRIEGTALGYAQDKVDIYSASWGPNDDGKTLDGPGRLALESLERGVTKGRNGKGSIFVWASGNGGSKGDNCNCDGYLASPYTISIGSASQKGEFPWYGEACASTLAVTYSSGAYKDQMIATTDLHNECTIKHTGTSASAPLAAGIIALALEVNPRLNWRDVQHLIVWTSEVAPVTDNPGWQRNAAGFWFNTRFGFGLMNAFGLVKAASNWTSVPERNICTVTATQQLNESVSYGKTAEVFIHTTGCKGTNDEVTYLEHIELTTTITYPVRGSLEVFLTSPSGSKVQLLNTRKLDKSRAGFNHWTFMSVMTWGESAAGDWSMTVVDNVGPEGNQGYITEAILKLHGTTTMPQYLRDGPRNYNHDYNRVHNSARSQPKVYSFSDLFPNDLLSSIENNLPLLS